MILEPTPQSLIEIRMLHKEWDKQLSYLINKIKLTSDEEIKNALRYRVVELDRSFQHKIERLSVILQEEINRKKDDEQDGY